VAAAYAVVFHSDGSTSRVEMVTQSQMELVGVPVRGLTFFHSREPGSAPSRANGVGHPRVGRHRGHAAEELGDHADEQQEGAELWPAASMKICAAAGPRRLVRSAS
jgi:hypothetical protein